MPAVPRFDNTAAIDYDTNYPVNRPDLKGAAAEQERKDFMKTHSWNSFFAGVVVTTLAFSLGAPALAATVRTLEAAYSGIRITLDGAPVETTDAAGAAVEPFAVDGTVYLPIRAVASALGLTVDWDQEGQTVVLTTGGQETPAVPEEPQPPEEVVYDRNTPVPVGTAHTFQYQKGDDDFTVTLSVTESIRGADAWETLKTANRFNDPAPMGKEYVLVHFDAKVDAASNKDATVSFNLAAFDLYSADSAQYTQFWTVVTPTPKFDGRVYEGGKLDGWLAFLVNESDPAPKVVFGADYSGAGGTWFALTA